MPRSMIPTGLPLLSLRTGLRPRWPAPETPLLIWLTIPCSFTEHVHQASLSSPPVDTIFLPPSHLRLSDAFEETQILHSFKLLDRDKRASLLPSPLAVISSCLLTRDSRSAVLRSGWSTSITTSTGRWSRQLQVFSPLPLRQLRRLLIYLSPCML
jgi:hypothetical protein